MKLAVILSFFILLNPILSFSQDSAIPLDNKFKDSPRSNPDMNSNSAVKAVAIDKSKYRVRQENIDTLTTALPPSKEFLEERRKKK